MTKQTSVLLVVDDSPDNLLSVKALLRITLPECQVVTAASGEEALTLAAKERLDAVLIDYWMPGIDGIETCRRLKKDKKTAHLPVVIITARTAGPKLKVEALEAGADDFLGTPINGAELAAKVKVMLRAKRSGDRLRQAQAGLTSRIKGKSRELGAAKMVFRSLWNALINGMADGVLMADTEKRKFVLSNGVMRSALGYSEAELLRLGVVDIHPQEDRVKVGEYFAKMAGKEMVISPPLRVLRKDGSFFWAEINAIPMTFEDVPCLFGIFRDVTARMEKELALRESEKRFLDVIYSAPDAVLLIDGESFVDCNDNTVKMLGYPEKKDFLMTHPSKLSPEIQPDGRRSFEKANEMMKIAMERGFHRFSWSHRKADGEDFPVEVSLTPVVFHGRTVIHCLWRDLSQAQSVEKKLKETQDQFYRSQKLELVGQLAAGIAHDFNNLLTVVKGAASFLGEGDNLNDEQKADSRDIIAAVERGAYLTNQLLAFGRKQLLTPSIVDLNKIVMGMEKLLRRVIPENIHIATFCAEGLGAIEVDPSQIEQVIMNLTVNARDAMPDGGKLVIETSDLKVQEPLARDDFTLSPGRYVLLTFSDTGKGMNEATRVRIFEPFFTTKGVGKGTGLGLASVYGIIKQSKGFISVYSEPGRGSNFKVYFPRVDAAASFPDRRVPSGAVKGGSETILYVEDDAAVRKITQRVMQKAGYHLLVASDGEGALEIAKRHEGAVSLLLTDIIMPKMDGTELADRVMKSRPGIKVFFTSGYTSETLAHGEILGKGCAFLPKPYEPHVLLGEVRRFLDKI